MPCSAWRVRLISGTVATLTEQAYAPCQPALGALPLPVAEDYAPRIATGEVRLFESAGRAAGLLVIETHGDHCLIFSVVVSPGQRGKGFGIRPLEKAEQLAREVGFGEVRRYTNALMLRTSRSAKRSAIAKPGASLIRNAPAGYSWI